MTDYVPPKSPEGTIDYTKITADSDAAFHAANEHGGIPLLDKDPQTPIRYAMMFDKRVGKLIWLVLYDIKGTDLATAKLHIVVDAQTGKLIP
jgi:hypothetical protein